MDPDQLHQFKTMNCEDRRCPLRCTTNRSILQSEYLGCQYFHDDKDRRRSSRESSYHPLYPYDSIEMINQFCNNIFEYLFHPSIYKTQQCGENVCGVHYCPYYHKQQKDQKQPLTTKFSSFNRLEDVLTKLLYEKDLDILTLKSPTMSKNRQISNNSTKSKIKTQFSSQVVKIDSKTIKEISGIQNVLGEKSFSVVQTPRESQYYLMNQQVKFFEDATHEFKMLKQIRMDMVAKYICAFLNARGGSLFMGITDEGRVRGIKISREDIDLFQLELDHILRKFDPCVLQEQIIVSFLPIFYDATKRHQYPQCFIIEIQVVTINKYELYFTHKREAYIKRAASINMLCPKEIKAYVRQRTISQVQDTKLPKEIS